MNADASISTWQTDFWDHVVDSGYTNRTSWFMVGTPSAIATHLGDDASLRRQAVSIYSGNKGKHRGFTLGNIFFVCPNTRDTSVNAVKELRDILSSPGAQRAHKTVVLLDIAPYPEYWPDMQDWVQNGGSGVGWHIRAQWVPVFEEHQVSLVLSSGPGGVYQRGERRGTKYIQIPTLGSGPHSDLVSDERFDAKALMNAFEKGFVHARNLRVENWKMYTISAANPAALIMDITSDAVVHSMSMYDTGLW